MTSTDMLKLAVSVRQHLWELEIFFKGYFVSAGKVLLSGLLKLQCLVNGWCEEYTMY